VPLSVGDSLLWSAVALRLFVPSAYIGTGTVNFSIFSRLTADASGRIACDYVWNVFFALWMAQLPSARLGRHLLNNKVCANCGFLYGWTEPIAFGLAICLSFDVIHNEAVRAVI